MVYTREMRIGEERTGMGRLFFGLLEMCLSAIYKQIIIEIYALSIEKQLILISFRMFVYF